MKTKEEILSEIEHAISSISDPRRRQRLEKQLDIMRITFNTADSIINQIKKLPSNKKKIFTEFNRRPLKKQKTKQIIGKIMANTYLASNQLNAICAAPIPKYYPAGTNYHPGGALYIGTNEPELIFPK